MITDPEYAEWTETYRRRFIPPGQDYAFVRDWHCKLCIFEAEDLKYAIDELMADPRTDSRNPRYHLPLIMEHARDSVNRRASIRLLLETRARHKEFDRQRVAEGKMTQVQFDQKHPVRP